MKLAHGVLGVVLCAGCTSTAPDPAPAEPDGLQPGGDAIPITITNEAAEPASVKIIHTDEATGRQRPAIEPFEVEPGESVTVHLEPTRDQSHAFHLFVNEEVALSSDFLGCRGPDGGPLPSSQTVTVLPNGDPQTCP